MLYKKSNEFLIGDGYVYTDGSCDLSTNSAGSGVFFNKNDPRNMSLLVPGTQTNQRAELYDIKSALDFTEGNLCIYTDSKYSINVCEKKYNANVNLDIIQPIWDHMDNRSIKFIYTPSHVGILGNEMADSLCLEQYNKIN